MKTNTLSHLVLVLLTVLFCVNVGCTQSALPVCRSGAFENFQRGGCLCETTPGTVECFSRDNRTMVAQVNDYVSDELRTFRWSDTSIDVGRLYGTNNRYVYYCQSRLEKGYVVWPPWSDLGCFKVLGFCDPLAQYGVDSRCCAMPHCANCTFPTLCTQCIDNYTLVNDTCVAMVFSEFTPPKNLFFSDADCNSNENVYTCVSVVQSPVSNVSDGAAAAGHYDQLPLAPKKDYYQDWAPTPSHYVDAPVASTTSSR